MKLKLQKSGSHAGQDHHGPGGEGVKRQSEESSPCEAAWCFQGRERNQFSYASEVLSKGEDMEKPEDGKVCSRLCTQDVSDEARG